MRHLCRAAVIAVGLLISLLGEASDLRVLYAESFQPQASRTGLQKTQLDSALQFTAFGRTFELELEDNSALLRHVPSSMRASIAVFKGTVRNMPGSWVRLTQIDGQYQGAFWDGADLYAIGPSATVSAAALVPLAAKSGSAIYRLSDTQGGLFEGTCGLEAGSTNSSAPLDGYRRLVKELRASIQPKVSATREISVAMIADYEFGFRSGAYSVSSLIDRANITDGIFSSQTGISIVPTDFVTYSADNDPFSQSDANKLLNQLADFKNTTTPIRDRGLAHLVTGRELDGTTVGVAYLNSACDARAGVSLSESSSFIDSALIMAHEIGHNLGARHDAEAGSECASTPASFLMAPQLNFTSTLSSCSVQSITAATASKACIVSRRDRDVAVTVATPVINAIVGTPFELTAELRALGTDDSLNITASLELNGMTVQSVSLQDGACTTNFSQVTCSLTQLPAGQSRQLVATITPSYAGQSSVSVNVNSWNDINVSNNSAVVPVNVSSARDLELTVNPQPLAVVMNEPFDMTFDVRASGALPLGDAKMQIQLPWMQLISAVPDAGSCVVGTPQSDSITCSFGALPAGATRRLTVRMSATNEGTHTHYVHAYDQSVSPTVAKTQLFTIATRVGRDLAVKLLTDHNRLAIGVAKTLTIEVESRGVYAVAGTKLRIQPAPELPEAHLTFPSFCAPSGVFIECDLGTIASGAKVTIPLGVRVDERVQDGRIDVQFVHASTDDFAWNDFAVAWVHVLEPTEISIFGYTNNVTEESVISGMAVYLSALGAFDIENGTVSVTMPDSFEIRSIAIASTVCTVPSGVHTVTCMLPRIPGGDLAYMSLTYVASQPGTFTGTIEVSVPGDADASNNALAMNFEIAPFVDARIAVVEPPRQILTTSPLSIPFTATTNRYALPDAILTFNWFGGAAEVEAAWSGGSCSSSSSPLSCDLGDLPANSTTPITVTVRVTQGAYFHVHGSLHAPAEVNYLDNNVYFNVAFFAPSEIALEVGNAQPAATAGQFTTITGLKVSGERLASPKIEFDFDPKLVSSFSVFGASCESGSTPVSCDLYLYEGGSALPTIQLVPIAAGTFPIRVKVSAFNDTNAANNEGTLTVTVSAPPSPPIPTPSPPPTPVPTPSGGSSKGGGGGSFDAQLLVGLVTVLLVASLRSRRRQRRLSMTS